MGNKQSTNNANNPDNNPKKTDEELMKERWLKLAANSNTVANTVNNANTDINKTSEILDDQIKVNQIESEANKIEANKIMNTDLDKVDETIKNKENNEMKDLKESKVKKIEEPKEQIIKVENTPVVEVVAQPPKIINKENNTIQKIFRITLNPEDNRYNYLPNYHAMLVSESKEEVFAIDDLENILMEAIALEPLKNNVCSYLLESYHRAIEMIERRYKHEFDDKFQEIRKLIASYISLIMIPNAFWFKIEKLDIMNQFIKYFNNTDDEEIGFLLSDLINACQNEFSTLQVVFGSIFSIIHIENTIPKINLFNLDKIKRNLTILTRVLNDFSIVRKAYVKEDNFSTKGVNGQIFQSTSFLATYFNISPFEVNPAIIKNYFTSLHAQESDNQVRTYSNKLNNIMNDVTNLVYLLLDYPDSRNETLSYFYDLINLNLERTKMYSNQYNTSSIGFLMTNTVSLLKLFYEHIAYDKASVFEIVKSIDLFYCVSNNTINFNKFDRINIERCRDLVSVEAEKMNNKEFNLTTKLFFIIHNIISYYAKNLDDEYTKLATQLSNMFRSNMIQDPKL